MQSRSVCGRWRKPPVYLVNIYYACAGKVARALPQNNSTLVGLRLLLTSSCTPDFRSLRQQTDAVLRINSTSHASSSRFKAAARSSGGCNSGEGGAEKARLAGRHALSRERLRALIAATAGR